MEIEDRKKLLFSLRSEIFGWLKKRPENIKTKLGAKDLLTEVDTAIEDLLREKIRESFPDDGIVGEEYDDVTGTSGYVWYIDPVDGTTNFTLGIPFYCTSVGVAFNREYTLGVIFSIVDEKIYWAINGKGAYCEDVSLAGVSSRELADYAVNYGVYHDITKSDLVFDAAREIYPHIGHYKMLGSAALALVYIAEGKLDAYWAQAFLGPWDYAAGALILRECGGFVSNWDPETFISLEKKDHVFATNGVSHKEFVELVKDKYIEKVKEIK